MEEVNFFQYNPMAVAAKDVSWQRYTISFTAKRCSASHTEQAWPLILKFAYKDESNYLAWSIEGWTQTSSVIAVQDGNLSDLGLYYAPVPAGEEAKYRLEVDRGCIEAIVNGISHEKVVYRLPQVEELYYSASTEEESGDLIIKAVNLKQHAVTVKLDIQGAYKGGADVWELSGYEHEDVNTFEQPQKVAPKKECLEAVPQEITFAPESVTILRLNGHPLVHQGHFGDG